MTVYAISYRYRNDNSYTHHDVKPGQWVDIAEQFVEAPDTSAALESLREHFESNGFHLDVRYIGPPKS